MSKIIKFLLSLEVKTLFFFILYAVALLGSIIFNCNFTSAILICLVIVLLWKIILGISWVNFFFLNIAFIEANVLKSFLKLSWSLVFIFLFFFFFWQKCFASKKNLPKKNYLEDKKQGCLVLIGFSPMEKYWREVLFYYLFLIWIIIAYGVYIFLNHSFSVSFIIYLLGLIIFLGLYFKFSNITSLNLLLSFFILLLVNLEFFILFSYLSISVLAMSLLMVLIFRFLVYFFEHKSLLNILQ